MIGKVVSYINKNLVFLQTRYTYVQKSSFEVSICIFMVFIVFSNSKNTYLYAWVFESISIENATVADLLDFDIKNNL